MYFMNRCKNKHIEVGVLSLTKQELSSGVLFASVCLGVIVSSSRCKLHVFYRYVYHLGVSISS